MTLHPQYLLLAAALSVVGCSDATTNSPTRAIDPTGPAAESRVPRTTERYVAIGTSVSMGWASNGVYAGSQALAWPEQLAFGSGGGEGFAGSTTCAASPLDSHILTIKM